MKIWIKRLFEASIAGRPAFGFFYQGRHMSLAKLAEQEALPGFKMGVEIRVADLKRVARSPKHKS